MQLVSDLITGVIWENHGKVQELEWIGMRHSALSKIEIRHYLQQLGSRKSPGTLT